MKMSLIFLISLLFIACDGKRHIDKEKREIKIEPEKVKFRAQLAEDCKPMPPQAYVDLDSILKADFLLDKNIRFAFNALCEKPKSDHPCNYACLNPKFDFHLGDKAELSQVVGDYDLNVMANCQKFNGADCTEYYLKANINYEEAEYTKGFSLKYLGRYRYSGMVATSEIPEVTGEIWKVAELGFPNKSHFFISPSHPQILTEEVIVAFKKTDNNLEQTLMGKMQLQIPSRMENGDVLYLKSLNLISKLIEIKNDKAVINEKIKAINSKKEYPLHIKLEFEFEN